MNGIGGSGSAGFIPQLHASPPARQGQSKDAAISGGIPRRNLTQVG